MVIVLTKKNRISKQQISTICQRLSQKLISYKYLAKGGLNECYLIITSEAKYVLKIENNKGYSEREYRNLLLATEKLAPKVYLFDKSKTIIPNVYMVQEFLEGKHPRHNASDEFVIHMALWFKKLHALKSSRIDADEIKNIHSLSRWAYQSHRKLQKLNIAKKFRTKVEDIFQTTITLCTKNDHIFRRIKKFPLVHGDSWPPNVFVEETGIRLIDWEFAGFVLKERDLIIFMREFILSPRQKKLFLNTYGYPLLDVAKLNTVAHLLTCSDLLWLFRTKSSKMSLPRKDVAKIKKILSRNQDVI